MPLRRDVILTYTFTFYFVLYYSTYCRSALALDIALVGVGARWHVSLPWCRGTWSPSSQAGIPLMFMGFALMQNREFETVLGMAERFSGCLGVSRDCHLLANPQSPGSAIDIHFIIPGRQGWLWWRRVTGETWDCHRSPAPHQICS